MKKPVVAVVIVAALVAVGAYVLLAARRSGQPVLELSGTVETREIQVGSKVGGRVREVLVEEGQVVKKGAVLIRFEVDELLAFIATSQRGFIK